MAVAEREEAAMETGIQEDDGVVATVRVFRDFRLLLIGTVATNTAFWMYQVAVGWLALELTDSAFFVGLAGFAGGIPMLLLALPAGVLIDRHDRRSILLYSQVGVFALSALLAVLIGADLIHPWSLLLLVALYGSMMTFIFQVRSVMAPSMVDRRRLVVAVGLNSAVQNSTRIVGPSLAGILIATVGTSATFAIAAVMQIGALMATSRMAKRAAETVGSGRMWAQLKVGLEIVWRDQLLLGLVILSVATNVLVMPYINLMPVFTRDQLGLGSTGLGILLGFTGAGTVVGALWVAQSRGLRQRKWAQLGTALGFALGVMAFAMSPNVLLAGAFLFVSGMMSAAFLAINQTAMQLAVDDDVRGRVMSVSMLTWGVLPIGQLAVGIVANTTGAPGALVTFCLIAIALMALIVQRFPALRGASA